LEKNKGKQQDSEQNAERPGEDFENFFHVVLSCDFVCWSVL